MKTRKIGINEVVDFERATCFVDAQGEIVVCDTPIDQLYDSLLGLFINEGLTLVVPEAGETISETAERTYADVKAFESEAKRQAEKEGKEALAVIAYAGYKALAYDPETRNPYEIEHLKEYSDFVEVYDLTEGKYSKASKYHIHLDLSFYKRYSAAFPFDIESYVLKRPEDPWHRRVELDITDKCKEYIDAAPDGIYIANGIEVVNAYRRKWFACDEEGMFTLERRLERFIRLVKLNAPNFVLSKECELIKKAYLKIEDQVRLVWLL